MEALAAVHLRREGDWIRVVKREMDYMLRYNRT